MAAKQIDLATRKLWYGTAADMALTPPTEGDTFFIPDPITGVTKEYTGDGSSWVIARGINGGALDVFQAGGFDGRGNYPTTWYLEDAAAIAATPTDDAEIYTSSDVSMYNTHTVENTSAADDVTVQGSLNGTNYSADLAVRLGITTGATLVLTIGPGEFGTLDGKFFSIRVLKNGVTNEVPSIRFAHSVK